MRVHVLFLFCLFALLPAKRGVTEPAAEEIAPPGPDWHRHHTGRDFAIFTRPWNGSSFKEHLLVGTVKDVSPRACFSVATDYERYPEFMPYVTHTVILERETVTPRETRVHAFFVLHFPVVSDRYFSVAFRDETDITVGGKTGCYRSSWHKVKSGRWYRTPDSPDLVAALGKEAGGVEIREDKGTWLFEPVDNGRSTRFSYCEWSEPGGHIPSWLQNLAGKESLSELYEAFTREASSAVPAQVSPQ